MVSLCVYERRANITHFEVKTDSSLGGMIYVFK